MTLYWVSQIKRKDGSISQTEWLHKSSAEYHCDWAAKHLPSVIDTKVIPPDEDWNHNER